MSTCAFSNGFDSGFEICTPVIIVTPPITIRGVPSLPKPRRRPQITEVGGVGLVAVIGAGRATADASITASLTILAYGLATLVCDAIIRSSAAIANAAEGLIVGVAALAGRYLPKVRGGGSGAFETMASAEMPIAAAATGNAHLTTGIAARMPIRSAGEGTMEANDDEMVAVLAAAFLKARA